MKRTFLIASALTILSGAAFAANKLESVKLEPARIKAGSSVTITVTGDETQGNNCGFRINYGNGEGIDVKVTNNDQFPRTFTKTYPQPGTYTVSAESKKVTSHFGCSGGAKATLVVEALPAPAPVAAPAPATTMTTPAVPGAKPAAKAVGNCPDGYQASYVAADGSYACKPPVGAVASAPTLVCPAGYAGSRVADGSVRCKPIPKPAPKPKTQCPSDLIYFENPDGAFGCRKPAGK
jgi:hypothetical protein